MSDSSRVFRLVGGCLSIWIAVSSPNASATEHASATERATASGAVRVISLVTGTIMVGGRQVIVGREVASSFASCETSFAHVAGSELASGAILALEVSDACETVGRPLSDSPLALSAVEPSSDLATSGIVGSGIQGIVGSGVQGIVGSGIQGIVGSGVQGIVGSGIQGIVGSGVN